MAAPTAAVTPHRAEWFLTREQFEPVPELPGLYRLTQPEQDGQRRARQAVRDLRTHGFAVQADYSLDPAPPSPPARTCASGYSITASASLRPPRPPRRSAPPR